MEGATRAGGVKPSPNKACTCCREAHSACDSERPCRRCIRLGRAHLCSDVPPRKRGRRPKHEAADYATTTPVQQQRPPQPQPTYDPDYYDDDGGEDDGVDDQDSSYHLHYHQHHQHRTYTDVDVDTDQHHASANVSANVNANRKKKATTTKRHKKASGAKPKLKVEPDTTATTTTTTSDGAAAVGGPSSPSPRPPPPPPSLSPVPTAATTTATAAGVDGLRRQVELLDGKFELLTQLLNSMAGELKQLRQANEALASAVAHTQTHIRDTDVVVADLLRADRERLAADEQRAEAKAQAQAAKKQKKRLKAAQQQQQRQRQRISEEPDLASLSPVASSPASASSSSSSSSSSTASGSGFNSRTSFSFELSLLQSGVSPAVVLEARQQLPWLCHYDISPTRFAILDFTHPVYVLEKMTNLEVPSRVSYANEAFMRLSGYSWSELIGMPFPSLFTGHERYLSQFTSILYNQPAMSVGIVYTYYPLMRCKDGSLVRLNDRGQFFYNHHGQAQYCLKCIDTWEPGRLREGEGFDRWIPLRPALVAPFYEVKQPADVDGGDEPDGAAPPVVFQDELSPQPSNPSPASLSASMSASAALASLLASAAPFPPVLPPPAPLPFPPLPRPHMLAGYGPPPPAAQFPSTHSALLSPFAGGGSGGGGGRPPPAPTTTTSPPPRPDPPVWDR